MKGPLTRTLKGSEAFWACVCGAMVGGALSGMLEASRTERDARDAADLQLLNATIETRWAQRFGGGR